MLMIMAKTKFNKFKSDDYLHLPKYDEGYMDGVKNRGISWEYGMVYISYHDDDPTKILSITVTKTHPVFSTIFNLVAQYDGPDGTDADTLIPGIERYGYDWRYNHIYVVNDRNKKLKPTYVITITRGHSLFSRAVEIADEYHDEFKVIDDELSFDEN